MTLIDLTPWQYGSHFEDSFYIPSWAAMWSLDEYLSEFSKLTRLLTNTPPRKIVSEPLVEYYLKKQLSLNPLDRKEELVDLELA